MKKLHTRWQLTPISVLALTFALSASAQNNTVVPPAQPALKHFVISDYGAVADGQTLNTVAIQKAVDAASTGGGVVEIPKGTFLSGSIFLKPGVELYLDEGAVLLGSEKIEDYPKRDTRIEGHFEPWRMALVNAQNMDHVRIGGKGQLNGNGKVYWEAFWQGRRDNPRITNLAVERPRLMFIDRCKDVQIEGLSLQDSGFWNLHVYHCDNVLIEGLRINASSTGALKGPSTDGMDIDSSQNVTIRKCQISCNDDNIALKGSKGPHADQDADSPPVENILVEDCEIGDGNGLITCGSEATIVRNVTVRNCTITGKTNLLTLKLRPDTPQHYSNITIDGVKLSGGAGRILNVAPWTQFFDLQGQPPPTRSISNVTIRNISGDYGSLGTLRGNQGDTLSGITLENVDLKLADEKFTLGPTENLVLKNVAVNGKPFVAPAPVAAAPLPGAARATTPAPTTPPAQ